MPGRDRRGGASSEPHGEIDSGGAPEKPETRAFVYLRVSSEEQTRTDHTPDGLSINAQREAAEDKARQLGARIAGEFSDPGKSAFVDLHKRTAFLAMLDELKRVNRDDETHIDFVIVWALNRWARNQLDHWRTRDLVKQAGAKLISITEPMIGDDTPESFFMEGMFALNNQYESMKTGRNVQRGMHQKAKGGGTYHLPPLGYLRSTERMDDGRDVRAVKLDHRRAPFVRAAFKLYATGQYSIARLTRELHQLGLRTRSRPGRASGRVSSSALQQTLRNPYYIGSIVFKRRTPDHETFAGRHEPLIDEATFVRVGQLLDENRVTDEQPRAYNHYLRGLVYCGSCREPLIFSANVGRRNSSADGYFFCGPARTDSRCAMRANVHAKLIERAVARHYSKLTLRLPDDARGRRTAAVKRLVAVSQRSAREVRLAKRELVASLKAQQADFAHLDAVETLRDEALPGGFRDERTQLQTQLTAAEKSLALTNAQLSLDAAALRLGLDLAKDLSEIYREASMQVRRDYNQAFFRRLYVAVEYRDDRMAVSIADAELTELSEEMVGAG